MAPAKKDVKSDQSNKPKGKPGPPKGTCNNPKGRPKGILGLSREQILNELRQKHPDYNPLTAMLECAEKVEKPAEKAKIHAEVAQYILPKMRAVELSNADGSPVACGPPVIIQLVQPEAQ